LWGRYGILAKFKPLYKTTALYLMKYTPWITFFLVFSSFLSFSQEWTLPFSSKVEKNGKKLQGATVSLMQGSKQVMQTMTGEDGAFKFQIPPNGDYTIVVTKQGHCTKKFTVSTRNVPEDKKPGDFKGFNIEAISLFEPIPGIDYSVLNQPLVKVTYDATKDNFDYDEAYSNQMLSALDRLRQLALEAEARQKELEANYAASIKAADAAFKKKDWVMARAGYNQALTYKPTELYPKDQLAQIEVILKDQEALNKKLADEKAASDAAAKAASDAAAKKIADDAAAKKAADDKAKADAAAKALADASAKKAADEAAAKKAADEKAKADAEAARLAKEKADKELADKLAKEAAAKKLADEVAAKKAAEDKAKADADAAAKKAAEDKAKADAEAARLAKEKADKELAEKLAKEAATKKAADDAAKAAADAAAKKAADEAAAKKAAEDKLKADAEAARLAKEKADKELADKLSKDDAAKKAAADVAAKKLADEAAAKKAADDKAKADAEAARLAKEEAARLAKEKADKELNDKLSKEDAAKKAAADAAAKKLADEAAAKKAAEDKIKADADAARLAKEEAARLAKEKADKELNDKLSKEDAAKKAAADKLEADRLAKEAADKKLADDKAKAESEAARLAKEKADKELNDKLSKEDAAKKAAADAAAKKAADDKLKADAEAARLAKEAADKSKITTPPSLKVDKYKEAKDKGDALFSMKRYKEAKLPYEEALIAKAGDSYAKGRLAEIEKLLKSDVATAVEIDAKKQALLAKYPPGVTEETLFGTGVVILQRVVVKETDVYTYQKKMFSWGGISYFRDAKAITESTFEQETKP
jgi:hypothetical protein